VIYLDNAATSHPKPEAVYLEVDRVLREVGGSPGRSGHRLGLEANRVIYRAREAAARLIGAGDASRIIFTSSATESLNLAAWGALKEGDHVITSCLEHNSLSRPLFALKKRGVEVTRISCGGDGLFDPDDVRRAIRSKTALIALTHASNVVGVVEPAAEIGALAREMNIAFLLDASQTAGSVPIDVERMNIDLLAAPGHKGLYGPQGTGILYIGEGVELRPLKYGGTGGGRSSQEQPEELPDRYEAGTMNTPGIAGLGAGISFILEVGTASIRQREIELVKRLLDGLKKIGGVTIHGPMDAEKRAALVSISIKGLDPSAAACNLDGEFNVLARGGLLCAPEAHRFLGLYPEGSLRLSPGYFNSIEDIDAAVDAVRKMAGA